jgi:hypothetical protein
MVIVISSISEKSCQPNFSTIFISHRDASVSSFKIMQSDLEFAVCSVNTLNCFLHAAQNIANPVMVGIIGITIAAIGVSVIRKIMTTGRREGRTPYFSSKTRDSNPTREDYVKTKRDLNSTKPRWK